MRKICTVLLLLLSSCSNKVVKIVISNLQINKVEVNASALIDTIEVKSVSFPDSIKYIYDKKTKSIYVPYALKKKIVMSESSDSLILNPPIHYISIGKVSFKKKKFKQLKPEIIIENFSVDSILINKRFVPPDYNSPSLNLLGNSIKESKSFIDSMMLIADEKINSDRDHSARLLPKTDFFKKLKNYVKKAEDYFFGKKHKSAITESRIEDLIAVNIDATSFQKGINDKRSEPRTLQLFYDSGSYELDTFKNMQQLTDYLREIYQEIDSMTKFNDSINVWISVTGYADDVSVTDELYNDLIKGTEQDYCKTLAEQQQKDCRNKVLSEQRAKNVFKYIDYTLKKKYTGRKIIYASDWIGRGIDPPTEKESHCHGGCPERRVVRVSISVFTSSLN